MPPFCKLHVDGRWVKDAQGNIVILHGANLPTLTDMQASERKPEDRLRQLAAAGARVVRLAVDQREITPTFVPAKVSPFVDQANALGILVILVYRNDTKETVNTQADNAEDWLRLTLTYLLNAPGVWFEPFDTPIDTPKWQAINQRMVDIVRGFRADNVVVIGNPTWLKDAGAAASLDGRDIVYSVESLGGQPLDAAPFVLMGFDGANMPTVRAAHVWTLTAGLDHISNFSGWWRSSQVCK